MGAVAAKLAAWRGGAAAESRDGDELANGLLVPWWSIGQGGARTQ